LRVADLQQSFTDQGRKFPAVRHLSDTGKFKAHALDYGMFIGFVRARACLA
jgi:hypothetical protein